MANKKLTIQDLKDQGLIAYEYVRGSWAHGLQIEGKSDIDVGGVYFAPVSQLLGLREDYQEQISDEKNDTTYYEFGRWMELILKSNPQALESLYVEKQFVRGPVHPAIEFVINNRDAFLSKKVIDSLCGYSVSQIKKAYGLGKKIVNPVTEKKDLLDFCYTFEKQGSIPVKEFLKVHNLNQKYCGVVNIPNMKDVYGIYYDFAAYFKFENIDVDSRIAIVDSFRIKPGATDNFLIYDILGEAVSDRIKNREFFHYGGIIHPDDPQKSNEVRLSSIPKGEHPICYMSYNKDAYTKHCKDYASYKEWEQKRNPVRYESNLNKNYDAKNMCECTRLMHTGLEIARGEGFNVRRTWDREFLLNIKNHGMEYDEILSYVETKKLELEEAMKTTSLPEAVDKTKLEDILITARELRYHIGFDPGSLDGDQTVTNIFKKF